MMIDLSTKAGVLRFCENRRAEMVGCFDRLGQFESPSGFSFMGYAFATRRSTHVFQPKMRTGPKLAKVEAVPMQIPKALQDIVPARQQTELFSRVVREFARATRAIGVVTMAEAWLVEAEGKQGQSVEEVRAQMPESLGDVPGRMEALLMMLEHSAAGRRVWKAAILDGPRRVGPWMEQDWDDAEGRLVGMVDWKS
jgi:hypothetical protein